MRLRNTCMINCNEKQGFKGLKKFFKKNPLLLKAILFRLFMISQFNNNRSYFAFCFLGVAAANLNNVSCKHMLGVYSSTAPLHLFLIITIVDHVVKLL